MSSIGLPGTPGSTGNVLCSGGAGFIGSHLVDALIKKGYFPVIIDDLSTGLKENINSKAIFIRKDINDDLGEIFDHYKFDYVFHLAARMNLRKSIISAKDDAKINIIGSLNIIENCVRSKVKHLIFSSTGGAMYFVEEWEDQPQKSFVEEYDICPISPYGLAKSTIESYLDIIDNIYELPSASLRYSNVYGPRQNAGGEAGAISIFIEKALRNEDIVIFGNGEQSRDFIFVDDVISANLLMLDKKLEDAFNVGSNTSITINELADKIIKITNSKSKIIHKENIIGEIKHTKLNCGKLQNRGWSNKVDFDTGLEKTIKYYQDKLK